MKQTTPDSEGADPEASGLLWGLLKILCTNYGNLFFVLVKAKALKHDFFFTIFRRNNPTRGRTFGSNSEGNPRVAARREPTLARSSSGLFTTHSPLF